MAEKRNIWQRGTDSSRADGPPVRAQYSTATNSYALHKCENANKKKHNNNRTYVVWHLYDKINAFGGAWELSARGTSGICACTDTHTSLSAVFSDFGLAPSWRKETPATDRQNGQTERQILSNCHDDVEAAESLLAGGKAERCIRRVERLNVDDNDDDPKDHTNIQARERNSK